MPPSSRRSHQIFDRLRACGARLCTIKSGWLLISVCSVGSTRMQCPRTFDSRTSEMATFKNAAATPWLAIALLIALLRWLFRAAS